MIGYMAIPLAVFLSLLLFALLEAGRRIGVARREREPDTDRTGLGAMEGAVFGLLGLLIAFTFSGAAARFEDRRALVVQEANAVGTAYLRLDLLPDERRLALQAKFRSYLDGRLEIYRLLPDLAAARTALDRSAVLQAEIWRGAVAGVRESQVPGAHLLLPAINEMIDITTTRTAAAQAHPPPVIFAMLLAIAMVSALLAGIAMAGRVRQTLHMLAYAVVLGVAIYVILDLEFPRFGLIRIDAADAILVEARRAMD